MQFPFWLRVMRCHLLLAIGPARQKKMMQTVVKTAMKKPATSKAKMTRKQRLCPMQGKLMQAWTRMRMRMRMLLLVLHLRRFCYPLLPRRFPFLSPPLWRCFADEAGVSRMDS